MIGNGSDQLRLAIRTDAALELFEAHAGLVDCRESRTDVVNDLLEFHRR